MNVIVDVIGPVIVDVHVHVNSAVIMTDAVDDRRSSRPFVTAEPRAVARRNRTSPSQRRPLRTSHRRSTTVSITPTVGFPFTCTATITGAATATITGAATATITGVR